ncbi:flagellin N-terminal helical domain-containing protein [Fluviispira vulneris]|uniref:flagellin N-terminal helical domain-containing protein n=1 Tax=Fluviispira vulneris TaxID=2763012 RepID=UPI00164618D0|nr:flagellin [Fluviispira vulneris]
MGFRIATNVQSLNAQRNLNISNDMNNLAMEKLSSGFRINKASDDAAGLAISEKLKADYRGLVMARRNASDGVSLIQTAEGGLNEIGNILSRLRELSVQGASDTIGNIERGFLNKEFSQLKDEITRISKTTEFNGTLLLVGNQDNVPDEIKKRSNEYPLEVQVGKNFFESIDGKDQINPTDIIRIDLSNVNATVDEEGLNLGTSEEDEKSSVNTKDHSQRSISVIDDAITKVSGYRATMGAIQSRLNSTINQLSIQAENNAASNSRIRDTDFAEETAKLAQTSILKQSGVAVLAQTNQTPALAIRLLG